MLLHTGLKPALKHMIECTFMKTVNENFPLLEHFIFCANESRQYENWKECQSFLPTLSSSFLYSVFPFLSLPRVVLAHFDAN